ncbi:hypothetical protein [Terasakiella pusilla]|uniref:hypothetical protein n=1 Tax=Terasakiella pusilla TaxID=64973 RepID=UPI003AA81EEC
MTITLQDLKEARAVIAKAIKKDGAVYLPIFRRLQNEVTKREQEADLLEQALSFA